MRRNSIPRRLRHMTTDFSEWLQVRSRRKLSPNTLRQKTSVLATVTNRCSDLFGITNLADVAKALSVRENVEALLDSLALTHSSGSIRNVLYGLADFARYARAQGWAESLALDPAADLPPMDYQQSIMTFTQQELSAITAGSKMKGLRWEMFVATLMQTGRRIGEVLDIKYSDLNLDHETPHIHLPHTKSQKSQYAPLNAVLRDLYSSEHLEQLRTEKARTQSMTARSQDTYLYPFTYVNALRRWTDMLNALGIPYRSPHKLRHTKATTMIAAGAPMVGVSRLLGHANVATTDRFYSHVTSLSYAALLDN